VVGENIIPEGKNMPQSKQSFVIYIALLSGRIFLKCIMTSFYCRGTPFILATIFVHNVIIKSTGAFLKGYLEGKWDNK
jgi:hypothetical protein